MSVFTIDGPTTKGVPMAKRCKYGRRKDGKCKKKPRRRRR